MKRVAFGECVGWLHDAPGDTAVVLCATIGHEAMWSHRALRHLADDLAAAGVPALRFDYPGTGDAAGAEAAPGSMAQWERAIVDAAAWMRARTGTRRVVLCGLRLGAMLAVLAAETMAAHAGAGADGLVLIAPPLAGQDYLGDMRMLHANWRDSLLAPGEAPCADGALPLLGYRLSADTVARIDALRLDERPRVPGRRVLLLDAWPGSGSPVAALAAHYQRGGACVTLADFPEYPRMMQCADLAAVPERAWRDILHWLGPVTTVRPPCPPGARAGAAPPLLADGACEWPLWLDGGRQFGILCTPHPAPSGSVAGKQPKGGTVVIFPNSGGSHHVGDCRIFVTLSRQLARMGAAALRLDVSMLGDTPSAAREVSASALMGERSCRDVAAAVDWVRARGYDKVVVAGIGTGGWLGLQAALRHPGVDGLVLANLPAFPGAGAALRSLCGLRADRGARSHRWPGWYAWNRVAGLGRRIGRMLRAANAEGYADARGDAAYADAAAPGANAARDPRTAMHALHARGVRVDLLYGKGDIGLARARAQLGGGLDALAPLHRVHVRVLPWHDHKLWLPESRDAFAAQLVLHVRDLARDDPAAAALPANITLSDP